MKRFSFPVAAFLSLLFVGCSTPAKLEVGVKEAGYEKVSLKTLISDVERYQDKKVVIEGSILRVCQGRGCWVEVSDGTTKLIAKSIAHDVLLPMDCAGDEVQVMGRLRIDPKSTCGTDHAHEKSQEEHGKHTCPQPSLLLEMEGAKLF